MMEIMDMPHTLFNTRELFQKLESDKMKIMF